MTIFDERLRVARELSWQNLGKRITFYLPGMFTFDGHTGKYPALSVTADACELLCDHCCGKILESMVPATTPAQLVKKCVRLAEQGHHGVLISGGCSRDGRLPWGRYLSAIAEIKAKTGLFISIHCGLIDDGIAFRLHQAGVDQALIDVIGDDATFQKIYHLPHGVSKIETSLAALQRSGLPIIPHIVCGLNYGRMGSEKRALEIIASFNVEQLVIVSLMPLPGTPVEMASPPTAEEIADVIAAARSKLPKTPISLGCARQRGNVRLELLAIDAGINRLALPSEEALARARAYGLQIDYQETCCSVPLSWPSTSWH